MRVINRVSLLIVLPTTLVGALLVVPIVASANANARYTMSGPDVVPGGSGWNAHLPGAPCAAICTVWQEDPPKYGIMNIQSWMYYGSMTGTYISWWNCDPAENSGWTCPDLSRVNDSSLETIIGDAFAGVDEYVYSLPISGESQIGDGSEADQLGYDMDIGAWGDARDGASAVLSILSQLATWISKNAKNVGTCNDVYTTSDPNNSTENPNLVAACWTYWQNEPYYSLYLDSINIMAGCNHVDAATAPTCESTTLYRAALDLHNDLELMDWTPNALGGQSESDIWPSWFLPAIEVPNCEYSLKDMYNAGVIANSSTGAMGEALDGWAPPEPPETFMQEFWEAVGYSPSGQTTGFDCAD
jgi:hypothetical protein